MKKLFGILRSQTIYYLKPFNSKRLTNFYSQYINDGDLCFDVGANVGNRTAAWSKLGAKVICIDPQPYCASFLKNKFKNNHNVKVVESAVGEEIGTLMMSINTMNNTISTLANSDWQDSIQSMSKGQLKWDERIEVPVTTLSKLVEEYGVPAFCKIDVEGFEVNVLKGMEVLLPMISFEILSHTFEATLECLNILNSKGKYQFNLSFGESQILEFKTWVGQAFLLDFIDNYDKKVFSGDIYAQLIKK